MCIRDRAMRTQCARRLRLPLDIAVVVVLVCVGAFLVRSPVWHGVGVACWVVAAVFTLMLAAAFTIVPVWAFRRDPKFQDDYSLTFTPQGISFRTVHIDPQLQRGMYSRVVSDADAYLLYYGSHRFAVIPRRAFAGVEEQRDFGLLLAQHVGSIVGQ